MKGFAQERHGQIFGISSDLRPGSLLLCPGHLLDCRVTDRGDWPGCLKAPLVGGQVGVRRCNCSHTTQLQYKHCDILIACGYV